MYWNVSLWYLPGTGMYLHCFWLAWDPYRGSKAIKIVQNCAFFPNSVTFWSYFKFPLKSPCIWCIPMFSWGTYQLLACISNIFGFFESYTGSVGLHIGPGTEHIHHFCHILGSLGLSLGAHVSNATHCFPGVPTGIFPNCSWHIWVPHRALKGPKIGHLLFLPLFGLY